MRDKMHGKTGYMYGQLFSLLPEPFSPDVRGFSTPENGCVAPIPIPFFRDRADHPGTDLPF